MRIGKKKNQPDWQQKQTVRGKRHPQALWMMLWMFRDVTTDDGGNYLYGAVDVLLGKNLKNST